MRTLQRVLLVCVALLSLAVSSRAPAGGISPCCPSDVNGDTTVNASGVAIATDLGGRGVSGSQGEFSFTVEVGPETDALSASAVVSIRDVTYSGTKLVSPITVDGVTDAGGIAISAEASCSGEIGWLPEFVLPGLNGFYVQALAGFDDGSGGGPALYAGSADLNASCTIEGSTSRSCSVRGVIVRR